MAIVSHIRFEHIEPGYAQLSAYNAKLIFKIYQKKWR
jgi:hypothetical protein